MLRKALAAVLLLAGVGLWAIGFWQVYEANTVLGAVLVVAGALVGIAVFAWWQRDPAVGIQGVLEAVVEFITRA